MKKVVARSPTRVDLAGATLDLWPLHHLFEKKCTVNVGVSIFAEATIEFSEDSNFYIESEDQGLCLKYSYLELKDDTKLPLITKLLVSLYPKGLPAIRIKTAARSPKGAGLGGSSSLAFTVAGGLVKFREAQDGFSLSERDLVKLISNIESSIIRIPTGTQDQWGAARGGINIISYSYLGEEVKTLDDKFNDELSKMMTVCFSGQSRESAVNNWEIYKKAIDGDKDTLSLFKSIGECACEAKSALLQGDFMALFDVSHREWALRSQLLGTIETEKTRSIMKAAKKAGASLGRVCGAGGGGALVFFGPSENQEEISKVIKSKGGTILDACVAKTGFNVEAF